MTDRNRRWFGILNALTSQGLDAKEASDSGNLLLAQEVEPPKPDRAVSEAPHSDFLGPETPSVVHSSDAEPAFAAKGFEEARAEFVAHEAVAPSGRIDKGELRSSHGLDEAWIGGRTLREQSLLRLILTQDALRAAVSDGPIVELRASADERRGSLLPIAAVVEINSSDAKAAQAAIRNLKGELNAIFIHGALQFLTETRQFLGLCFSKLALGGMLVISAPHQFLYERKLRLPSRRNRQHRRFYTSNTLLADVEEAIDPCEFRVRFLGESDGGFPYRADLKASPDGGQDILLAIEKISRPPWRSALDEDEIWSETPSRAVRYLPLDKKKPAQTRIVAPDPKRVNRVIVIKLDHRGDFMMAGEAFRILRRAFESAEITLVCGSWNMPDAHGSGLFEEVIPFDFFPEDDSARLETPPRETLLADFAKHIEGKSYDLAIDLRLYDDSREVLQVIDARNRAGFDRYDSFPWLSIRLNTPSATVDDRAETGVITAALFHTSANHKAYEIAFEQAVWPQESRAIIWGPYQELRPGRYQFECLIEPLAEDFEIPFDIVRDSGSRTVAAGLLQIERGRHPRLDLQVDERVPEFEFRLVGSPKLEVKPFRFMGLRYLRPSVMRGAHQSEAMALLAHLVELRLRSAYTTELI